MLDEQAGAPAVQVVVVSADLARGKAFVHALSAAGFAARLAPSVVEAGDLAAISALVLGADVETVAALRATPAGERLALIASEVPPGGIAAVLASGADEAVAEGAAPEELAQRLRNALRLRGGGDRARLSRAELGTLLEIAEAATSHLELEDLLRVVVGKIAEVVPAERCSAILVERGSSEAVVMASHDVPGLRRLRIDITRYPELRRAIESRTPVVIDDIHNDPRMAEVRPLVSAVPSSSLVVAPLVAQGDAYGVLFLRLARDGIFGEQEQAFVRAAASAVANSVRNARLHTSVREKRDALESAYQERYRELDRANEQLREANRIKDEVLAVLSHDLRAPLNVLLGHARLLLGMDLAAAHRRSVEVVERQGLRILQLVQEILEKARGRRAGLSLGWLDLSAVADEVTADLATLGRGRRIAVRRVGESAALHARADESAFRQILENLVSNAVTHAPDESQVEVEVSVTSGDRARVEIRDRGPGIPEEERALVFERYRKGDGAGLGLGLAICKELVELHGGEIWVEGREGGGTSFVFTLPLRRRERTGKQPELLAIGMPQSARESLTGIVGERFSLSIVPGPAEGIAVAAQLLPDAILFDLSVEDATACARALRSQPGLGEVPLVCIGAEADVAAVGLHETRAIAGPDDPRLVAILDEVEARWRER